MCPTAAIYWPVPDLPRTASTRGLRGRGFRQFVDRVAQETGQTAPVVTVSVTAGGHDPAQAPGPSRVAGERAPAGGSFSSTKITWVLVSPVLWPECCWAASQHTWPAGSRTSASRPSALSRRRKAAQRVHDAVSSFFPGCAVFQHADAVVLEDHRVQPGVGDHRVPSHLVLLGGQQQVEHRGHQPAADPDGRHRGGRRCPARRPASRRRTWCGRSNRGRPPPPSWPR